MKGRLEHLFPGFVERLHNDPEKTDALGRGERVLKLLQSVPAVEGEQMIPSRSLLREFIGGSSYDYH